VAVAYLHHRLSEDLDFFSLKEIEQRDVAPLARSLGRMGFSVNQQVDGPRRMLVLSRAGKNVGHIDIAHYPFEAIARSTEWRGLKVDSLLDMTVNKVQALLTRARARDYLDLYFLLQEGPERDLDRLLTYVRTKFETGADRLSLAERFLRVREIRDLPKMIRSVSLEAMARFFEQEARRLIGKG
jgi:hypothetical protein